MKTFFWVSFIVVFYIYIGYPVMAHLLSLLYKERRQEKYIYPDISIIMSVYNEEENIANKLKSIFELDYPKEKIEILIGSDGSTDGTDEIASAASRPRNDEGEGPRNDGFPLRLYKQEKRSGKPSVLNMLVKEAKGEILVFTDARQALDKDSVKELVKNFSDPKIGSVSAELFFREEETQTGRGVGLYWEYEKFIRKAESRIGSMLGATGALYAIRRSLYSEVPSDLLLDDMYIPMAVIQKGYRAIFDNKAKIYDKYSSGAREEFARKVRTLAGNFQLFVKMVWARVWWQFISHKFMRLLAPYFLGLMFLSNFDLVGDGVFYAVFMMAQLLFYIAASLGMAFKEKSKLLDIPYMFCVMNAAAVEGLGKFLLGKQEVTWKKT